MLCRLVEDIHEFCRLGFKQINDFLYSCDDDGIEYVSDDADDKTSHSGHHGFVDARREQFDVNVVASHGHVVEGFDHSRYGAQEAEHGGCAGYHGQDGDSAFQFANLQVANIFNGFVDVAEWAADA